MELYPAEVETLRRIVEEWSLHDERELEATFKNADTTTTFLDVVKRLTSKGYKALPQEDKMNIITPEQVRFTLTGMAAIESYCRDDTLVGKPFSAMVKDRAGVESQLDLDEYDVRIKVRREQEIDADSAALAEMMTRWGGQRKAFRIMRRWSFINEAQQIRFDLSMVRSTKKDARGQYFWQKEFKDQDIARSPAFYEIEVELLRPKVVDPARLVAEAAEAGKGNPIVEESIKNLIRGIGEVLRGIQKHSFLCRKSEKTRVLEAYKSVVKTEQFRGVAPISIETKNMRKEREGKTANIRDGYNVTDKADGLRMMGFVDANGELFMLDMSLNVYKTGLLRMACAKSLVDGEFVTRDAEGNPIQQFLLFDIYIAPGGEDVTQLPFAAGAPADLTGGRHEQLQKWSEKWNEGDGPVLIRKAGVTPKSKILVAAKDFQFAGLGDREIFEKCGAVLAGSKLYHTDGLILTPNKDPMPEKAGVGWPAQLKWKPAEENTVDFLSLYDKDLETRQDSVEIGVKPVTGETVRYKTMRLYVGSSNDPAFTNPRGTVLYEQPLPGARGPQKKRRDYKPVLFSPQENPDTMSAVCYSEVVVDEETGDDICRCENGDPILDRSIVEMRYDATREPGWRWIPMRIRWDKTERYQKKIKGRTFNKDESAEGVWNSIHDPVTLHMITTGAEAPSDEEIIRMRGSLSPAGLGGSGGVVSEEVTKIYYDRKAPKEDLQIVKGLKDFHRVFIKEKILLATGLRGGGRKLVDLACGQGGDLWSWVNLKAEFVYGTDIAGFGITDPQNGAYRRYINAVTKYGGYEYVPKMVFTIGSSAKNLASGEAGATPEEANIMRAVYGQREPDGPLPKFVEKYARGQLRKGADCVAIMFAIHYFFENSGTLDAFLQNISDSLATGGLFIGCCFDGQKIFDAFQLQKIAEGQSLIGKEGETEVWRITRRFSQVELTRDESSLGLPIDVQFVSIGTEQREYLVPFELLKAKMATIGCELLTEKECSELGLPMKQSTALFQPTFELAQKKGMKYPMTKVVQQYSFFNRWFIFKRRRGGREPERGELVEAALPTLEVAEEAAAAATATAAAAGAGAAPKKKTAAERQAELREKLAAAKAAKAGAAAAAAASSGAPVVPLEQVTGAEWAALAAPLKAAVLERYTGSSAAAPTGPPPAALDWLRIQAPEEAERIYKEVTGRSLPPAEPAAGRAGFGGEGPMDIAALAGEVAAAGKRTYEQHEILLFYADAPLKDPLGIKKMDTSRWLAPSARFPIKDLETGVEYPSVEHFMAGMKYKVATTIKDVGARLFSSKGVGSIHQDFLAKRDAETRQGTRELADKREMELLQEERKKIIAEQSPTAIKKYGGKFNEEEWLMAKDQVLREALRQRVERDAELRKILTAAKAKNIYLLYYTGPQSGSELGGKRLANKTIDGQNKVGVLLMELFGYSA